MKLNSKQSGPVRLGKRSAAIALALSAAAFVPAANAALITITNGIYTVHVENTTGSWNAVTAAGHPVGANKDITFDGTTVSTNFSSLRLYGPNGNTTYTASGAGGGIDWNSFITSAAASTTYVGAGAGYRINWSLPSSSLSFSQELAIGGTTYANSGIYQTVVITNNAATTQSVGWRNLMDWAVNDPNFDDGPSNSIGVGTSVVVPTTTNEFVYIPTAGSYARVAAAPVPAGGPTYEPFLGLGFDPGFIIGLPVTTPDQYDYVSWPGSVGTAFDYTTNSASNVTGDSAGLSYFGVDLAHALVLAPGASIRLTQTIYAVPPGQVIGGVVPEPSTMALFGLALVGLGLSRRATKE